MVPNNPKMVANAASGIKIAAAIATANGRRSRRCNNCAKSLSINPTSALANNTRNNCCKCQAASASPMPAITASVRRNQRPLSSGLGPWPGM